MLNFDAPPPVATIQAHVTCWPYSTALRVSHALFCSLSLSFVPAPSPTTPPLCNYCLLAHGRSAPRCLQDLPWPELPEEVTRAFDVAYSNIRAFHEAQRGPDLAVETMPGVTCRRVTRPINSVGLYVPGGTAVLPSSALMLAVPAQIAGGGSGRLPAPGGLNKWNVMQAKQ